MSPPTRTTVLRICMRCRALLGLTHWPASDRGFAVSHGLCDACYEKGVREVEARVSSSS